MTRKTKRWTVEMVEKAVAKVDAFGHDNESAHVEEDALYVGVLEAIADGRCDDPVGCARAAITARDLTYTRWYA